MSSDALLRFIEGFNLAKYKFILQAKDELNLPLYKGSTIRGGFGITFKKICCVNKIKTICFDCFLKEKCAYAYIFETSPPKDSDRLKNIKEIPRPFIIEPPPETKTQYKKDEILEFNLILIGKAIEYLPYFVFTFRELGNIGLGKGRGRFELDRVYNFKDELAYDADTQVLKDTVSKIDFSKLMENFSLNSYQLTLSFLSPTRIKIKNDLIVKPEFYMLIKALLHRLSALFYFHSQRELNLNYNLLISEAKKVKIKNDNLSWFDWERYSFRQDTRMKLGGFIGKITYEGDFKLFFPLIILGQFTHVGKNCTFGLGRYEVLNKI